MISLYFNCKILDKEVIYPEKYTKTSFYPVTYPNNPCRKSKSQFAILIETLTSYLQFSYENVILNIEVQNISKQNIKIIEEIFSQIRARNKELRFTRPSYIEEWVKDIAYLSSLAEENYPLLIVMNHDHPFVDYTPDIFIDTINMVFNNGSDNFKKVFTYSHISEQVADLSCQEYEFDSLSQCYKSKKTVDSVASIVVTTLKTLDWYIKNLNCSKSQYLGRLFDWHDVVNNDLKLMRYLYPREFFKHYDGYGHITGIREKESNPISTLIIEGRISRDEDIIKIIDAYYTKWFNTFYIYIRDCIKNDRSNLLNYYSNKKNYSACLMMSIEIFDNAYLKRDTEYLIIDENLSRIILDGLINKIFYEANYLYNLFLVDLELNSDKFIYKFFIKKIKFLLGG